MIDHTVVPLGWLVKGAKFSYTKDFQQWGVIVRNDFADTGMVLIEDSDGQYKEEDGLVEVYV